MQPTRRPDFDAPSRQIAYRAHLARHRNLVAPQQGSSIERHMSQPARLHAKRTPTQHRKLSASQLYIVSWALRSPTAADARLARQLPPRAQPSNPRRAPARQPSPRSEPGIRAACPYSWAMRMIFRIRSASSSQQGKSSPRSAFFAIIASGATAFSTQVTP